MFSINVHKKKKIEQNIFTTFYKISFLDEKRGIFKSKYQYCDPLLLHGTTIISTIE